MSTSANLRPAIATSTTSPPDAPERLHPLLYPLAAYLAIGTLILFLVSQLDAAGAAITPWTTDKNRWHEGSAGWMALFPLTTPFLVLYGLVRIGYAVPARILYLVGQGLWRIGGYVCEAWAAVRAAIGRVRVAVQTAMQDAMRAVRRTAELTVRRVRAALVRR